MFILVARPKKEGQIKLNVSLPEDVVMKANINAIENRNTLSGVIEELLRDRLGLQGGDRDE